MIGRLIFASVALAIAIGTAAMAQTATIIVTPDQVK